MLLRDGSRVCGEMEMQMQMEMRVGKGKCEER
jgi:hypothetical protein